MKFMNVCILFCVMSLLLCFWFTCFHFSPPRFFLFFIWPFLHLFCLLTSVIFLSIYFLFYLFILFFMLSSSVPLYSPSSLLTPVFPSPPFPLFFCLCIHPAPLSSAQITITRGEECVLEDNSQRTKWKVISTTGNEAMVPSVCFTVPPPNQDAMDTASKWDTYVKHNTEHNWCFCECKQQNNKSWCGCFSGLQRGLKK